MSDRDICYTTEALRHAQCAYFISIIIVQWADLSICKTRKLSISQQGMTNWFMNFGLVFETVLGAALCYIRFLALPLGTRDLQFDHFGLPALPYFIVIFVYDEVRKMIMRQARESNEKKGMLDTPGWVERNTYW